MTKKVSTNLLTNFLGDMVLVFMSGVDAEVQTEEGIINTPMVLQGILVDIDKNFILLGDENGQQFSLVNINNVAKLDSVNETNEELLNLPPKKEMN